MTSLRELQRSCYRAFLHGDTDAVLAELGEIVVPPIIQTLVYQNNARETFRKALLASFPVVDRLVGKACFESLALKYMRERPSERGDLRSFGRSFPAFLDELYAASDYAYLPDVARLEWALEEVHLEPNERALDVTELRGVAVPDQAKLTFKLRRATRLLGSPHPILAIWRANQPDRDGTADLGGGGENVVVLRRGDDVELHALDGDAFALASQFARGNDLQAAIENFGPCVQHEHTDGDLGARFAAALQTVVGLGLVGSVARGDRELIPSS